MTTPTRVRPRPSTDWAEAMQMPNHDDGPGGQAFLTWARQQGLQPSLQEPSGHPRLTLTGTSGIARPVDPGTWVIVQRDTRDQIFIETCTPEYFTEMFEPARQLRVETYRSVHRLDDSAAKVQYWWRVVHTSTGENMGYGEGYASRTDRDHAVQVLWPDLDVIETTS